MDIDKYKQLDILAIGDIVTDVFIKINDAESKCDIDGDHCKLCINYGGKIPYESADICQATGNSSNVAISAARLGLRTGLMTNIGNDLNGQECLNVLKKENVDTNFVKEDKGIPTNYHYVLWYNKERTILVKHEKFNYEWTKTKASEEYHSPLWLYLSSLGENSMYFHDEILNYLKKHIKVKLAFQPGTFQLKLGYDQLKEIYSRTDLILCNKEEAQKILGIEDKSISDLLKMMSALGPKIVVITDGKNGAYSYDGLQVTFMKALAEDPIETTGAGDSFSSAFLTALILNKTISEALVWGSVNAQSAVSFVGPHKGLLNKEQMEENIKNIPEDYQPIIII